MMPRKTDIHPVLLGQDWWEGKNRPKRIMNQRFATVLSDEDLSDADFHKNKGFKIRPRMPASVKASGASEVTIDKDGFHVSLDLDEFEFEELAVNTFDRFIEVHGKHEEKRDQYGLVSRKFRRRYMVPDNCDIDALSSSFTADHKLKIEAPVSRSGRTLLNFPLKVPVVEVEFKPKGVMELVTEELREIVKKNILENNKLFLLNNSESNLVMDLLTNEDLKRMENSFSETFNLFRVSDESAEPSAKLLTNESSGPPAEPLTNGSTEPSDELLTDAPTEPQAVSCTNGSTEHPAEPPTDGSAKPAAEPPTDGSAKPAAEPPTDGSAKPAAEPPTDGSAKPPAEPATDGSAKPAAKPPTDGSAKPAAKPLTDGSAKPTAEQVIQ